MTTPFVAAVLLTGFGVISCPAATDFAYYTTIPTVSYAPIGFAAGQFPNTGAASATSTSAFGFLVDIGTVVPIDAAQIGLFNAGSGAVSIPLTLSLFNLTDFTAGALNPGATPFLTDTVTASIPGFDGITASPTFVPFTFATPTAPGSTQFVYELSLDPTSLAAANLFLAFSTASPTVGSNPTPEVAYFNSTDPGVLLVNCPTATYDGIRGCGGGTPGVFSANGALSPTNSVSWLDFGSPGAEFDSTVPSVPEPATYGLIGLGLMTFAFVWRRRTRA